MYSVLNYIGKKEVDLLKDMEVLRINTYCEPFSGSFNTGFKLIDQGYEAKYILNDLDENIYNFWFQLKYRYIVLNFKIKRMLDSIDKIARKSLDGNYNKELLDYLNNKLKSNKDSERAAAEFIYRQLLTVNGVKYRRRKIDDILLLDLYLNHDYLKHISIFNKNYKEALLRYDDKNTFFFVDPPYKMRGVDKYYRCKSHKFNHKELYKVLRRLKGRWLLTYNYDESIAEMYKDYNIEVVERNLYGSTYKELYIRNYKI